MTEPPDDTRAYFRGTLPPALRPTTIVAANWDSLVFDIGDDPLRRVPMMEPGRGGTEHSRYVVGRVRPTSASLLARLGS